MQPGVLQRLPGVVGALGDVPQQRRGDITARLVARGLQGCQHCLRCIEPSVPQGERCVQGRLLHVLQQGVGDLRVHVQRRGAEGHGGREVAGAGHRQESRGDGLTDIGRCLPGGDVEGQLVHDAFERIGGCYAGERCVVGRGDAAVHGRRGRMVGQFQVHAGGRAFGIDLDLESVQGRLVGLGGEAHGQTRVHGRQAGGVGRDGALGCCEVRRQGVGGEIGRGREGGHLALQCRDGGGVGADVGGVGGVFRLRGVGCEDRGELPGRDALELDHRRLRDTVVQDPPGQGGRKQ